MDFLAQVVQQRFDDGAEPPPSVTFGGSCSTIALPPLGRALNHAEFSFEKKAPFGVEVRPSRWMRRVSISMTNGTRLVERGPGTNRFTKAVEQLGGNQAPARLGGLYALEQLGQNNSGRRGRDAEGAAHGMEPVLVEGAARHPSHDGEKACASFFSPAFRRGRPAPPGSGRCP
ncbi:hypothetical protein ABZ815_23910 [Nonomuraea sp. NPDC047529]|uniref:hypothetical protein n=1 Tax=Nonomuraea sp. NPDC047529 TaxID=3155623 RepID=UPI0033FD1A6C